VCMEFHDKFIKLYVYIPHIIQDKTRPMHHHRLVYHYDQVKKFATLMTDECQWGQTSTNVNINSTHDLCSCGCMLLSFKIALNIYKRPMSEHAFCTEFL
jgi:hypothetical protein